ncbi:outer membrane protein assembly factor BamB family protein [Nocardioides baculatus]|uniref:PQQ-binding-like beta-propeller repeat protein n=1 Tax=Nocardioides baculatus TaxID=2801337 RepID=A0ABS1LAB4_9ACTN|nr:PQQ-binding-like beta-propeller repeat protein [Nocardioides baculatus]MBL0748487.1 PQQ-binding-like beta-propeller repeat protein [Nocardioides baculatus]
MAALALVTSLTIAPWASAEDWTSVRGGAGRNPASTFDPGTSFGVAWQSTTVSPSAPSCVVKAGGRLFSMVVAPNPSQVRLAAFDTSDGREIWTTGTFAPAGPTCPATDGQRVYVGTGYGIAAYRVADGTQAWRTDMDNGGVWGGPVVAEGHVYAQGRDDLCGEYEGVVRGCTFSFAAEDGALQSRVAVSGLDGAPGNNSAPLVNAGVVIGHDPQKTYWSAREVVARSLSDGAELWRDTRTSLYGQPVADDGVAYYLREPNVDTPGRFTVVARNVQTGSVLWTHLLGQQEYPYEVAVSADKVFVSYYFHPDGNFPGQVIALDRATGATEWATSSTLPGAPSGLIVAGRRLFAGSQVFNVDTGTVRELTTPWAASAGSAPAYADGTVYYWRAINAGAATLVAVRDIAAPTALELNPNPVEFATTNTPNFSWRTDDGEGSGLASHQVIVEGFSSSNVLPGSATSWQATPVPDGTYSWRLRTTDRVGNASTSSARTLVVDTVPPPSFDLSVPSGSTVATEADAALRWTPAVDVTSGTVRYEILVDGNVVATVPATACATGGCASDPLSALTDGVHTVAVRAVDRGGLSTMSQTHQLTVAIPPTAAFGAKPGVIMTGQSVNLNASGSRDFNGALSLIEWDLDGNGTFGDARGAAASTSFESAGPHSVGLRVTDAAGLTSTTSTTVDVRPAPPLGEIGVSINNGDIATNDPEVRLSVVWPPFASHALVSNDGGFGAQGGTTTLPLATSVPWTLRSSGAERLPKTMYVRFRGAGDPNVNYTDDIILDETVPSLQKAALSDIASARRSVETDEWNPRAAPRSYRIKVVGSDVASGISRVVVATKKSVRGARTVTLRGRTRLGIRKLDKTVVVRSIRPPRWVCVLDSAGNPSKWRRL